MKSCKIISILIAIALLTSCITSCKANEGQSVILDSQSSETSSVSNITTTSISVEPCDYIMYATGKTNIRKEMNNTSKIIDTIDKNTPVNVIAIYDNGWVEVFYDNQNYYCMKNNLTFDEPVIETTSSQTTTQIEEETVTTVVTTTKTDNSAIISQINEKIEQLEYENYAYKNAIEENNYYLSQYENVLSELEASLEDAEIQLSNAEKKMVYVYVEGQGFVNKPDQSAINEAQEYVDYINSLIDETKTNIEIIKNYNEEYQVLIDSNNAQIAVYQAEISDLS